MYVEIRRINMSIEDWEISHITTIQQKRGMKDDFRS